MSNTTPVSALDQSITLEHLSVTAKNLSQILAAPDFRAGQPDAAKAVEAALMGVLAQIKA